MKEDPPPHGGNVYEMARDLGTDPKEILDFSANINPLGFPPGMQKAALEALDMIRHYPDPKCQDLREALARYHGLSPHEIIIGNGSTELIYLVVRALRPRRALVVTPAFSEYERALKLAGVPTDFQPTHESDDFALRDPMDPLDHDMAFLANPTNPSGALLMPEEMLPVMEVLGAKGVYAVLDEAFVDFHEEASMKSWLKRFPRLVILRSFTKFFGMPGIRLGYVLAAEETIRYLEEAREPWSVNTMAQAMGEACLRDRDFMARTRAVVADELDYLHGELTQLEGLSVFPSRANYLLVKISRPGCTAAEIQRKLLTQGILIRDASNFRGLDARFFRIAVRLRRENRQLLEALASVLKGQ